MTPIPSPPTWVAAISVPIPILTVPGAIIGGVSGAAARRAQELRDSLTEKLIEADLIVSAIGQGGDLSGLERLDNGRGLIDADKYYQVPDKPGYFVCGDIVRPHLLTTAIGQASIAVDSIDHYMKQEELSKRPKVDVHHFDLLKKMEEQHLAPEHFDAHAGDMRGTSSAKYAVHNYEDRSFQEIIPADELFLGWICRDETSSVCNIGVRVAGCRCSMAALAVAPGCPVD